VTPIQDHKPRHALFVGMLVGCMLVMAGWCAAPDPTLGQAPTPTAPIPTAANPTPVPSESRFEPALQFDYLPYPRQPRDNDIRFDRISVDEGLSQSTVTCSLQDHKGFMWFGTEDGLNKYDGYEFTVFKYDVRNPNSLSDNYVQCLLEAEDGSLWIGTRGGGLNRFDSQSGRFTHYRHDPALPASLAHDNVTSLYEDAEGFLWVGTGGGGLDRLDPQQGSFAHHTKMDGDAGAPSEEYVVAILGDSTGKLWIGTRHGGVRRLDPATQEVVRYTHRPDDVSGLGSNQVTAIYLDSAGVLWIGTADAGLDRLDPNTQHFSHYRHDAKDGRSLSSDGIQCIAEDHLGVLWVGTHGGGLDRYDVERDGFVHYRNDPFDLHSLSYDTLRSIYEDHGGVLWIGTVGAGLNKANPANQKFVHYRKDLGNPNSLSDNSITAICADRSGALWVGTAVAGLNRYDRTTGQWTHFVHDPNDPLSLASDVVHSVYEDRQGILWVGTEDGLDRLDGEGRFQHFRNVPGDASSLGADAVGPILEDRDGALWVGTMGGGLNKLDRQSGRFTRYVNDPADSRSLSHNSVSALFASTDGTLWVGTLGGGLNELRRGSDQFIRYLHDPQNANSLSHDMVLSLGEDTFGRLYIGTWGGGLTRFNRTSRQFTHYREGDGLPNDVVCGILEDNAGNLWLSTNRGLSRFNPSSQRFRNYDVSDGLQSAEFNGGAYHRSSSGELFFGGINGLNALYPAQVRDNAHRPALVITSARTADRVLLVDAEEDQQISLSYPDSSVAFEFAALDYTESQKNQYQYKLDGFDAQWVSAGTRRYANYTNLRGGQYVFRVKGSNNDGVWNHAGAAIAITIVPPLWDRWWFRVLAGLLLVASAVVGYRLRLRNTEMRARELQAQVRERTYELERRRVVAEGLREILVILNSSQSLEESLGYIARQAALLTGAAQALVFRNEEPGGAVTVLGFYAHGQEQADSAVLLPETLAWLAERMKTGDFLSVSSVAAHEQPDPGVKLPPLGKQQALLGFPLAVAGPAGGGLVLLYEQERAFAQEDMELGLTLVDHAALAIANAELRDKAEQVAAETERSRLARDLHDAVTQTLFSASLIAEVLPRLWEADPAEGRQLLQELRQLSRGALAEMRTLLLELRPAALMEASLGDLLRQLAEAFTGRTSMPVRLQVEGHCALPPDVHVALYRIAQEALNNVAKHAHATEVHIDLRWSCTPPNPEGRQEHEAQLRIGDNGCGFDLRSAPADRLGLGIIRERAQAVGAALDIRSEVGKGTEITVIWKG